MARIAGVDLPKNKKGEFGLCYIYGIGRALALQILAEAQVEADKRIQDWTDEEASRVRTIISDQYKVEGTLRAEIQLNIKRLIDINCYRGSRHKKGLPCRGQRTRTNARTRKGKRKTVAGKKKAPK